SDPSEGILHQASENGANAETPSPSNSPDTIPATPVLHGQLHSPVPYQPYQQLTRGSSLWKQLLTPNNPLRIGTKSIHATVSLASSSASSASTTNHWVQLKW